MSSIDDQRVSTSFASRLLLKEIAARTKSTETSAITIIEEPPVEAKVAEETETEPVITK